MKILILSLVMLAAGSAFGFDVVPLKPEIIQIKISKAEKNSQNYPIAVLKDDLGNARFILQFKGMVAGKYFDENLYSYLTNKGDQSALWPMSDSEAEAMKNLVNLVGPDCPATFNVNRRLQIYHVSLQCDPTSPF